MSRWLTILGVGDDGVAGLAPAARALLDRAEIVVGSERVLAEAALDGAEIHVWTSPLSDMVEKIQGWRDRGVTVLATGDPMHFGIGATLAAHVPAEEMVVVPSPSAFSLAAARLGWALQEVDTISLHGRAIALLQPFLQPEARILALSEGASTLGEVAEMLRARGFGDSRVTVLEHMGGAKERVESFRAVDIADASVADFATLAIDCVASPDAVLRPRVPGLPDEAFVHDGQLTKREVRAVTLAALGPYPDALLWDVGAGCGSVAIEWMRAARGARAITFERHDGRLAMIAENCTALGTPSLEVVAGAVPDTLADRPVPDAIFLGGAVSVEPVVAACWQALRPGGRLVANAVTLEGQAAAIAHHGTHGGELVRIDIAHLSHVGTKRSMRPRMGVLQWQATKEPAS